MGRCPVSMKDTYSVEAGTTETSPCPLYRNDSCIGYIEPNEAKALAEVLRQCDEARRQRDELLAALEDTKPLLIGIESDPAEPSHRRERAKRLLRAFESSLAKVKGSR